MDNLIEIVNPDEEDFYNGRLFIVSVWCGAGYALNQFEVYGNDDIEKILEKVVAYAEDNCSEILLDPDEVYESISMDFEEEFNEYIKENPNENEDTFIADYFEYMYIDGTMEGASQPYYIRTENLRIKEIK